MEINDIEIKTIDAIQLACVRTFGMYGAPEWVADFQKSWEPLMDWAGKNGLFGASLPRCFALYHDDPSSTEPAICRADASFSITDEQAANVADPIFVQTIPAGKIASIYCELTMDELPAAWKIAMEKIAEQKLVGRSDGMAFEEYLNKPGDDGIFKLNICFLVE